MTNRSIGSHNPFREIESAMLCQHRLNFLRDELPIVRVYERDVFRDRWRLDVWTGMPHGFVASIGTLRASAHALDAIGLFLTERLQISKV